MHAETERKRIMKKISVITVMTAAVMLLLLCLLTGCSHGNKDITSLEQLNDPNISIGVGTGTGTDDVVAKEFPDAKIMFFRDESEAYGAIQQGKIDAIVFQKSTMQAAVNNGLTGVRILDETIGEDKYAGIAVSPKTKIPELENRINEFLSECEADGTLEEMRKRWLIDNNDTMPDIDVPENSDIHLTVATTGVVFPYTYYKGTELAGFDIELVQRLAAWMGASLEFKVYDYDGIVSAAQSGAVDCISANLYMTPERQETLGFSQPVNIAENGIMVRDNSISFARYKDALISSFEKTFIREDRWKLFLMGIGTTLLITVLSIIFGTLLGFCVFMACRRGNRAANRITDFVTWLIDGMPVVVLLMVFYYVIFGRLAVSGTAVSVISFTLLFASAVIGIFKSSVGAVDIGQTEGAYALGYSDRSAFYRIILPQAMPLFMPAYKGQIKALIKATAVVGYVAVQDLTKMGDIIRSRTYEAFFPLIAVAVIYFILAALLTRIVSRIELKVYSKQRTREQIMEGIDIKDSDKQ